MLAARAQHDVAVATIDVPKVRQVHKEKQIVPVSVELGEGR
jgi:hypothetical protein